MSLEAVNNFSAMKFGILTFRRRSYQALYKLAITAHVSNILTRTLID